MAVAGGVAHPAEAFGDAPAVGVYGEDLAVERVHHDAAGDLEADAGERGEEAFGLVVWELLDRGESEFAEALDDGVDGFA